MTSGPDNPNFFDFLDENQKPEEEHEKPEEAAAQPEDEGDDFFNFFSDLTPEKDALEEDTPGYTFSEEEEPSEPSSLETADDDTPAEEISTEAEEEEIETDAEAWDFLDGADDLPLEESLEETPLEDVEDDVEDDVPEDAAEEEAFPVQDADAETDTETETDTWGGFMAADTASEAGLPEAVPGGFSFGAVAEEAEPEEELAADDRLVRLPEDEREFRLSELIDVATGEPLDLRSLIPEGVARVAAEADTGYGMVGDFGGGMSFGGGGAPAFGADAATVGEGVPRKTPVRKTAPKKKKSLVKEIVQVVLGGLLALPIVHILLLCIMGDERNIPGMPTPFFQDTYYHVQEPTWSWMPTWLLPGYDPAVHTSANYKNGEQTMQNAVNDMLNDVNAEANANSSPDAAVMQTDEADDGGDDMNAEPDGGINDTPFDPEFDPMADMDDGADIHTGLSTDGLDIPVLDESDAVEVVQEEETLERVFVPPAYGEAELKAAVAAGSKAPELMALAEKMTFFDGNKTGSTWKAAESKFTKIAGAAKALAPLNAEAAKVMEAGNYGSGVIFSGTVKSVSMKNGFQVVAITADGNEKAYIMAVSPTADASLVTGVKCVIGGVLLDVSEYPGLSAAVGKAYGIWRGPVVVK